MKILIYGTGGVGGYFGGRLAANKDNTVHFVARGNYNVLKQKGLDIKSTHGNFRLPKINIIKEAKDSDYDLILITAKSYDTDDIIMKLKKIVSSSTVIISVQNGISNYTKLVKNFGGQRVIRGFCRIASEIKDGYKVHHTALGEIIIGEEHGQLSERLKRLKHNFNRSKIVLSIPKDIRHAVWIKFVWNSIFNTFTAASMLTVDKLIYNTDTYILCKELFNEIEEVANAEGIKITPKEKKSLLSKEKNRGIYKTSTYIDRQAGKPMEHEAFAGEIVRLAKKHGINVPLNRVFYSILRSV
jgi:2-dehydropantoate 2-reductase